MPKLAGHLHCLGPTLEDSFIPEDFCLADWCKKHSLSRKTEGIFDKEELSVESIPLLDHGEIRELGLPLGQRKLLQKAVAELQALLHHESNKDGTYVMGVPNAKARRNPHRRMPPGIPPTSMAATRVLQLGPASPQTQPSHTWTSPPSGTRCRPLIWQVRTLTFTCMTCLPMLTLVRRHHHHPPAAAKPSGATGPTPKQSTDGPPTQ